MERNIALYIYELDKDGGIIDFEESNLSPPKNDCIAVKINHKEAMQIDKLKIEHHNGIPKLGYKEKLKEVIETEFGLELTDEPLIEPVKSDAEIEREELLKQIAELDKKIAEPAE